jgi:hypothetical protein
MLLTKRGACWKLMHCPTCGPPMPSPLHPRRHQDRGHLWHKFWTRRGGIMPSAIPRVTAFLANHVISRPKTPPSSPTGPQTGIPAAHRALPTSCGVGARLWCVVGASWVVCTARFVISSQSAPDQAGCSGKPFSARHVPTKPVLDITTPRGIKRHRLCPALTQTTTFTFPSKA